MWIIQTSDNNAPLTNGFAELNCDMQEDGKEVRDGVTGEGQWLSEEDESRINEDVEGVNDGCMKVVQVQAVVQRPQHQAQEPLVQWERFLPYRSINILLAENDDSTRHVVTALLRNCGYEVTAVADGLQAWKLLEDLTNHIDLVLTEVILPCLPGIGLLCKIMNHKTRKNTPVVMMSPHDSMSIVFKCLSKGAVDYLVKPIRKNELKNLWQHVWRKCHSSSGSGSESGVRTHKSTKSKSEESDNDRNDEEEIGTVGLDVGDGSDHGSGTQGTWTKRALEVNPNPTSPWEQLADPADSSCADIIHSKLEQLGNNCVAKGTSKECEGQGLGNGVMGKDLEIRVPTIPNLQLEDRCERVLVKTDGNTRDKFPEINSKNDEEKDRRLELNSKDGEFRNQVVDLMGVTNCTDPKIEISIADTQNGLSKETLSLELSLKRLSDVQDIGTRGHDRNILRRSDLSAFSRYTSTANQSQTGNVGSCSSPANSSEAIKRESTKNVRSNSNNTPANLHSNGSSNNNDMGSTTNNAFAKPAIFGDKPVLKSTVRSQHPFPAFHSEQHGRSPGAHSMGHGKANIVINTILSSATREVNQQVQVQHHHHHYHHHHHHVHNVLQQQQQKLANDDNLSSKNMAVAALQCGSSNALITDVKEQLGIKF
ncbi:hypothetical protein K2173_011650 [Erythroxylum novogranatense]|uniref:Response regulatory domain-containing protein n=1 Tax=Erythroxylum novogranatense TaxID=1862640 RepID=A0AAV8T1Z9_9ROSI|nr:hypothetical protein K2173_011650 [Erythroxylum novogranatense]